MWHRHRDFGPNDDASLHWWYNLSSPYPADPDDGLLSCLSQKSLIAASEIFHLNLSRTGQGFPVRERRYFLVLANCHRADLAYPARRSFLAGNDDAEGPLVGWQRLAILGISQEDDQIGQLRVKLGSRERRPVAVCGLDYHRDSRRLTRMH